MIIGGLIAGLVITGLFFSMLTQQPPKEEDETSLLEFTSDPR